MRRAIILAAAMIIAACQGRNEAEVGPAPESDPDAPTTHAIDTTRTGPPGTGGRPSDATVTMDSVTTDTTTTTPADSAGGITPGATSTPQDTLGPSNLDTTTSATGTDTTGWSGTTTTDSIAADTAGYR
jgi:hypothetical protein